MQTRINPSAAKDLEMIRDYIAEDNEDMAITVINNILKKIQLLQVFPNMGTDLAERVSFSTEYKYVVWEEYLIVYKIENDFISIFRVLNRYQDITHIFN